MKLRYVLIATGLGLGFSPKAPGTVGALGGCLIATIIKLYSSWSTAWLTFLIVFFIPV